MYAADGVRFLRTTDITDDGTLLPGGVHVPEELVNGYLLKDDDLLISRSGTVGRSFLYRQDAHGPCSYAGYLVRFELGPKIVPEFAFYFTKTTAFADFLKVSAIQSTIDNVNGEKYANSPVPLPPVHEQEAIARLAAHYSGQVTRLIRNKRRLIALLNEEKQAIIQQAVTRGLDPDVPLKPSGVEWLGETPAHWSVGTLGRQLSKIEQGWSPVAAEGPMEDDQWAVLRLSAIRRGIFDPYSTKPIAKTATVPTSLAIADGDVLLTRSNTRDRVGDACLARNVRPRTIFSDLIFRLTPRLSLGALYLMYLLLSRTGRNQIEADARGSSGSMPKISHGHIRS